MLLFTALSTPIPDKSDILVEEINNLSENRTAYEINGANGTRFFIQRPKAEKLNVIYASDFGLSEENIDNVFADSGFLRHKEIIKSDNIYVWAQVNSQL